jgi:hypothetical protein
MRLTVSVCGVVVLTSTAVHAADQGVTGKKLLLKDSPKMVLLSKDALVVPAAIGSASDPRCVADGGGGLGGSVGLFSGTTNATLTMPCANWSANSAGTLYKYKDAAGVPKVGKVKAGLLKVMSLGLGGFPVPNGAATINVEVTIGTDKYCMSFSGSGDGDKFLVKDTSAGSCSPTCAGQLVGGFCWFLGASGASCDATCAAVGKTCDAATISYAGSQGTNSNCTAVLNALVPPFIALDADCTASVGAVGCWYFAETDEYVRCTAPPTTCAASNPGLHRACACQ